MSSRARAHSIWNIPITPNPPKNGEFLYYNGKACRFDFMTAVKLSDFLKDDHVVEGVWTFNGNVIFNGDVLANNGIHFPDNIKATFGNTPTNSDMLIYSDGLYGLIEGYQIYIKSWYNLRCIAENDVYFRSTGSTTWETDCNIGMTGRMSFTTGHANDVSGGIAFITGSAVNNSGEVYFVTGDVPYAGGVSGNIVFNVGNAALGTPGKYIFNQDQHAVDLQFKTVGNENTFYIDASTDRIGLNKNNPASLLDMDGVLSFYGANTQIWKDAGGDMKLKSSVAGEVFLADLVGGGMEYKYIKALAQSAGNLNLSDGTNWNVDKALIKTIRVVTASTDWSLTLYPDDDFDELGTFPSMQIASGFKGSRMIQLNHPYSDENVTKEVHLKLVGTGTFDIYIFATGME